MTAPDLLAGSGTVVAALGALMVPVRHQLARRARVPMLLIGWVLLLAGIAPAAIRDRWLLALAAAAVGLVLTWVACRLLHGRERWLLAAGAALLTLRIPVPTGDGTAMLLAPLYAAIGVGAVLAVRSDLLLRPARVVGPTNRSARMVDVAVASVPIVAALSVTWSVDRPASHAALAFFLVPFTLAYVLVRRWTAQHVDLRPAGWGLLGSGVVAACVGLYQAITHEVWWNPKVIDANRFRADFRTNSTFWDPNIYGRALVVAVLLVVAWLLVARLHRVRTTVAAAVGAVLLVALWHTFSQSSWLALAGALTVVGVLTIPPRPRRWVAAGLVLLVLVSMPIAAKQLAGADADGRRDVVRSGLSLAGDRPLRGWGIGSFETAALERAADEGERDPRLTASHTTPVTVVAELGVLGAASYLLLLGSAGVAILVRWRRTATTANGGVGWPAASTIWASGVLAAMVAHSMLYAGFFEDATLLVALAVLAGGPTFTTRQAKHDGGAADESATPPQLASR